VAKNTPGKISKKVGARWGRKKKILKKRNWEKGKKVRLELVEKRNKKITNQRAKTKKKDKKSGKEANSTRRNLAQNTPNIKSNAQVERGKNAKKARAHRKGI